MNDQELRMYCLDISKGQLYETTQAYDWVKQAGKDADLPSFVDAEAAAKAAEAVLNHG